METIVLRDSTKLVFDGVVVDQRRSGAVVQLRDPAVVASVDGEGLSLGDAVSVRVVDADPMTRKTRFALA